MNSEALLNIGSPQCQRRLGYHARRYRMSKRPSLRPSRYMQDAHQASTIENTHAEGITASSEQLPLEHYKYIKSDLPTDEDSLDRFRRHIHAVGRELNAVTEEHFTASAAAAAANRNAVPSLLSEPLPESALHDLGMQLREAKQNIVPLKLKPLPQQEIRPEGSGKEILLQGFNWESWKHTWYDTLEAQIDAIADVGFTMLWLPPPTDSVSTQGYMPRDLYNLDSHYGNEEALISLVKRFQSRGIKVLGDAVLNHRCAQHQDAAGVWNQFGGRLAWDNRAIVGDDPNFRGKGNRSSGDHFAAAPNIDHSQPFVKRDLSEWLAWLRTHVGFDGWRLDYVRGFHGSHIKDYMEASVPSFAVGEYWDSMAYEWDGTPSHNQDSHRQRTIDWITAAGGLSCAFDITTKGIMHAVFERCEYWRLRDGAGKPPGLMGWWPSRAVTFLENHDTGSSQGHWRFPQHALEQGYTYILTHPGTPCVFYDHLFHEQHAAHIIKRLVALRKKAGIHCRSKVKILAASHDVYAAEIDEKIVMKIGPGDFVADAQEYQIADCGHAWAVWEKKECSTS